MLLTSSLGGEVCSHYVSKLFGHLNIGIFTISLFNYIVTKIKGERKLIESIKLILHIKQSNQLPLHTN